MCAGICYEYLLSRVMEVAYVQTANVVSILSIAYGLCYGLGIGKVVVYFVTAFFVAIVSTILHLGFFPFSSLDLGMCAGICHRYLLSRVMLIGYVQTANVLSLLSIVYGFLCFCNRKTNSKKRRVKSTNLGSHNWSRRRVLWLQMKASRTEYVRLACKNKYGATMSMQTKRAKTTSPSHFVCSVNSINPGDRLKIKEKTFSRRKHGKNRVLSRTKTYAENKTPFPFYVSPKRIKKQIGFRRKASNIMAVSIGTLQSPGNKKKKKRRASMTKKQSNSLRRAQRKQTSLPLIKQNPPPTYHIPFSKAMELYKNMRKGNCFYASKKVILRNRHHLYRLAKYRKLNLLSRDYNDYPRKEKEYYVPEPPEQHEDPQWVDIGPEFPSDVNGDGPVFTYANAHTAGYSPTSHRLTPTIVSCGIQTPQPRLYVAQRNLCQILTIGHSPSSNKPAVSIMSRGKPLPNLREDFRVCNSPQEDQDPQWILTGPEYSSDYSGDGPQSFNFNVVDIPEFDPNNNFTVMPNWMRYDPNLEGSKRYTCIFC